MKNRKKIIIITAVVLIVLLIPFLGMLFYSREQSFLDIMPDPLQAEAGMTRIMKNDMESAVNLSDELFTEFTEELDQLQYRHITDAFGMDSFGRILYVSNGEHIELMFSNERGGSILVNPIDRDGDDPVDKVTGSRLPLEEIFDSYLERAEQSR